MVHKCLLDDVATFSLFEPVCHSKHEVSHTMLMPTNTAAEERRLLRFLWNGTDFFMMTIVCTLVVAKNLTIRRECK